ncbi:MAG: hypothetical protein GX216_04115 [Methanomicrobiales archaeon]|nr:hypothetical protein [Methanomicrobiales archaeon]
MSKNEVLVFSGESGISYTIDLPQLIETEIEPGVKAWNYLSGINTAKPLQIWFCCDHRG